MEQLFTRTQYENNELVAKAFVGLSGFAITVWICCLLHIFDFDMNAATIFLLVSIIIFTVPLILIYMFHLNRSFMKYVLVGILILMVGVYYCFFTFQMLIIFMIPSLIAMLYMNKRLLLFSGIFTTIAILISHVISNYYILQPWLEPFTGMKNIIQYGALPRMMQYGVCFGILLMIMNRMLSYMDQMTTINSERLFDLSNYEKEDDKEREQFDIIFKTLTEREQGVFIQVLLGKTNTQIADELCLSIGTVKNYITSIYDKIDIRERNYLILKFSRFAVKYDHSHKKI